MHWLLALAIVLNLFVLEEGEDPHQWTGYAAVTLVGLRLLWGFVGGPASRFRGFLTQHNLLATSIYALLWAAVLSLGATGFLMGTDTYFGEEWLEDLHVAISKGVQALVLLHLLGLLSHSVRRRRHAWLAMITGNRVP